MNARAQAELWVEPLDAARRVTYRAALKLAPLRRILVSRDRRVALTASLGILVGLLVTAAQPMLALAVTPAMFGIPHIAADVRYLVIRQRLPRIGVIGIVLACATLLLLTVADLVHLGDRSYIGLECLAGSLFVLSAIAAAAVATRRVRRAAPLVPLVLGFAWLASQHPVGAMLLFAHLHNLVTVGVWLLLFRRRLRAVALPLAVLALGVVLLASGATVGLAERLGGASAFGLHLVDAAHWYAPGLPVYLGLSVALTFVFLQGIHYAVWLSWIPQEEVRGDGTLSYRMSVRSLFADLSPRGVWIVVVACALMIGGSFLDLSGMRDLYLALALFHGYLEVAMCAFLWITRRPLA